MSDSEQEVQDFLATIQLIRYKITLLYAVGGEASIPPPPLHTQQAANYANTATSQGPDRWVLPTSIFNLPKPNLPNVKYGLSCVRVADVDNTPRAQFQRTHIHMHTNLGVGRGMLRLLRSGCLASRRILMRQQQFAYHVDVQLECEVHYA